MIVSSEIYSLDLSEYTNIPYFNLKKYFFIYKNKFLGEKLITLGFFFQNTSKLWRFYK